MQQKLALEICSIVSKKHPKNDLGKLTHGLNEMAENLEQLFASKNELLLSVSHELRSPMARMKVLLALLGKDETASKLNVEINKMNDIVEQLLESERLRDSHKLLKLETYFFPNILQDVLTNLDDGNRLDLLGDIPEIAVQVDSGRIKFLLRNLIQNALKYSSTDTKVDITCKQVNDELTVSVKDYGCGIEESFLPNIFEPFSQADKLDNRSQNGVGLGLFLCKRIALAHRGDLSVVSEVGVGSEFTFSIPILS